MANATRLQYDPNASYEVTTIDIVYRSEGGVDLNARIYQPQGTGPFPALIDVHGGAWGAQDHLFNQLSQRHFAASGLLVMAIDFRTSAIAPHPAALHDINYAVRWLKAHAPEYNGSSLHLGIVGWSSGGHQVMLGAMRPEEYAVLVLAEAPQLDARPAYVVVGWPVIDPPARYAMARDAGNEQVMASHNRYFGDEAGQIAASPLRMLERGENVELPHVLLVQGAADEGLPRMMAERFVELYSLAGGVIEMGKYPGEPHGFLRDAGVNTDRARSQIRSFIHRQLVELQGS